MSKLDQVVFMIENGKIIEASIREFHGFIDETTTPRGIGPRMHVLGTALWTWGHAGNNPCLVTEYDTEADAQDALEETFAWDFWHADFSVFPDRATAERVLADTLADAQE